MPAVQRVTATASRAAGASGVPQLDSSAGSNNFVDLLGKASNNASTKSSNPKKSDTNVANSPQSQRSAKKTKLPVKTDTPKKAAAPTDITPEDAPAQDA